MVNELAFTKNESKITLVLVLTLAIRLMGLFMLYPIFALRSAEYLGANAQLIGIAAGIYGFPQAMLQLPLGYLSDKFGRKNIIILGFILLFLGSVICALASNIYILILGRALQGAGAVGSVVTATIADNTREIIRTRAMAFLGIAIGLSFLLAIALGPSLDAWLGMAGIFWLTAGAAIGCLLLCSLSLPKDAKSSATFLSWRKFLNVILERKLLSLSMGIMLLHAILSSFFLVLPLFLRQLQLSSRMQSSLYLSLLMIAMLISYKAIYKIDQHSKFLKLDFLAIAGLAVSILLTAFGKQHLSWLSLGLLIFFSAFCILEARLPSLASKCAPQEYRGLALGFFSSAQFLGIFIGGMLGGMLNEYWGVTAVIYFAIGLAFIWLFMAGYLKQN